MRKWTARIWPALCCAAALCSVACTAESFRVVTYNLESYLDQPTQTRKAKTPESKARIRQNLCAMHPDVVALQEVGSPKALLELRDSLKADGLDLPYWEHVEGYDTNIHLAILSRFPFAKRHPYTNDNFLLRGRRFHVSRGFAEVTIQVNSSYNFTLIATHLKSRRPVASGDEAEIRLEEGKLLREKIDAHLAADPDINLVVLGDFNATKDSPPVRAVIGRYRNRLVDTRPAERNRNDPASAVPQKQGRNITWTHYYAQDDTYSRIDFLLLSQGMAREWDANETYVLATPAWGEASDHRPVVATFEARDK